MIARDLIATSAALMIVSAAFAQTSPTQPRQIVPLAPAPSSTMAAPSSDFLTTQSEDETITFELIGLPVYSANDEHVGRVENLIIDRENRVVGAILSVGGFLGLGSKAVAVPWRALQFETRSGKDAVFLEMSEDRLANAPNYKTLAQLRAEAEALRAQQERQRRAMEPAPPAQPPAKPAQ